ncbi:nitrogen regulation protein NR(II) [Pelosinus sp. sgz500959]|uniref:two-component system sensor histidine kinase NtrB n=1 Tax=Pelosinus sp. sgz500959 TaxID=3242472 RepID=UPI00366CD1DD
MADSRINHEVIKDEFSNYNRESQEVLLSKVIDLEVQCQALQEYNSELEESRSRYATVFDHSPVGYLILDTRGIIVDGNLTAAAMLGMQQENMIDLPFHVLVIEQDVKLFLNHLRRCKDTKTRVCTEFEIKSHSRRSYCVQIISIPFVVMDHQRVYYNTTMIDISNQKRLERELQRLDRLHIVGEMATSIAHEIRNPMTTVRGYLQLFKKRSSKEQEIQDIDLMLEEVDRANAIITEFLALAKNKNNQLLLKDINHIIQIIYPLVQDEAIITGNKIMLDLLPQLPMVLLDGKEIQQVLLIIINNALQSMKHGQVNIRTFMENEKVVVAVKDQGHGIPDEIKHKIGTPFFTTKDSGTGLGMAICYSIIQRHNAHLDFMTSPKGTTFFIRFPWKEKGKAEAEYSL